MPRALPAGINARTMDRALSRFAGVVGDAWVFADADEVQPYYDQFAPGDLDAHPPAAAVAPSSVEQVQAIVRIAGEIGVPLWTVSTGRNLAYGGAAPVMPGCVVLDLRRMNRILEVDEDIGYALVEPGVTFFDLHNHLQQRGGKLWISSPAPGWGSVMGNALERGFGPMPYGDHASQVCGLEVVLADGGVLRTGMGALPGAKSWQMFKNGFGPGWDGAFMQSNLGVVTKLGIWLMPKPESMAYARVKFAREEDLAAAVDTLRPLRVQNAINGVPSMRNAVGSAVGMSQRAEWYDKPGPIPDSVIETIKTKLDVGWWTLQFGIYGAEDVVRSQARVAEAAFQKVPGAEVKIDITPPDVLAKPDRGGGGSRTGIPGLNALGIVDWRGGAGGHIDFSPIFPPRGEDAMRLHKMSRALIEGAGQDYMGTIYNFGRAMVLICAIVFDRNKTEETKNVRDVFGRLISEAGKAGYGEYRTHVSYMDDVAAIYSWNDHALGRFNERVKDALDPKGILSPGKQGVWPKRWRKDKA